MANWFEVRADTMTEEEALDYFGNPNLPKPEPNEMQGVAIYRAYLADVKRAAEVIETLDTVGMHDALTRIFAGEDPPGAVFKAAHDQVKGQEG